MLTVKPAAPFTRDEVVAHLASKRIQTRMRFAVNLVRQPALTLRAEDRAAQGLPAAYRVAGPVTETDRVMSHAFWVGIFPGLTETARSDVVDTPRAFVAERKSRPAGLRVIA